MKLAIIGSRKLKQIKIDDYIPQGVSEIVSGGAIGVDTLAKEYANRNGVKLTEFLPNYHLYQKVAPLKRNEEIAKYADEAPAFWDGKSHGTAYTIRLFRKYHKKVTVIIPIQ